LIIDDPTRRRTGTSVRAICFPHEDEVLARHVQETLDGWNTTGADPTPDALANSLAAWYPQVAVSVREPIAELWETGEATWYIYRDGSLLSSQDDTDEGQESAGA
jgi:hypothetical protein